MICVRCGHCCKQYMVIIVDDPEKGLAEGNLIPHMGTGEPCKHLVGDAPGSYSCGVHHYPWFEETPCADFTQIGKDDEKCRMGVYVLQLEAEKFIFEGKKVVDES